jgi:uncharacterized protein
MFYVILGLMLALDLAWWRYADGLLRPVRRARLWRGLAAAFAVSQLLLLCWMVLARRLGGAGFDGLTPTPLISAAYLWHLIALPLLLLLWIATGVVTMPWRLARWLRRERVEDPGHRVTPGEAAAAAADLALEPQTCVAPSRRQFLGAAFAAAPPVLTAGTVAFSAVTMDRFRVRPLTVPVPNLPRDFDGLSIAHVTDVHVGRFTDAPQLRAIVEATNKLDADFVLLTGDLINNALADLSGGIAAVEQMQSRHGSYLCVGNHDLIEDGPAFVARTRARLPLLVGESRTLSHNGRPVQLLGLPWTRREAAIGESVDRLLARERRDPDAFPILLAHHPHAFDAAAEAGVPLTVAGHTHGGQLMLSDRVGFGPLMYRYWSGLYTRQASSLVVSNGVGNWFPLRVHAPAEIVHITLRRA